MWSRKHLDIVTSIIDDETKEVLSESYRSLDDALIELSRSGVEIESSERYTTDDLRALYRHVGNQYGLNEVSDYEVISFLVCLELGFSQKIVPILRERRKLKTLCGSLIFATHRFLSTPRVSTREIVIREADIFERMADAQNARWLCDFPKCTQIINSLNNDIPSSDLSQTVKQHWMACVTDLRVEAALTTSRPGKTRILIDLADEVTDAWARQGNYVKMTHAYLRKAVLYRQAALMESDPRPHLIASLDTLIEAEEEAGDQLAIHKDQDSVGTLISLYLELAKAYAQAGTYSRAWDYFYRARKKLDAVSDNLPRRHLDLVRSTAVILAEQNNARKLYEINQLEAGIQEMRLAVQTAETRFVNDPVLREILVKDLIPLLAVVGNSGKPSSKEAAEDLLWQSRRNAIQLKLFHQMRGLNFIADKFSMHLPK